MVYRLNQDFPNQWYECLFGIHRDWEMARIVSILSTSCSQSNRISLLVVSDQYIRDTHDD